MPPDVPPQPYDRADSQPGPAGCRERGLVDRDGPGLRALAGDPEVRHAPVLVERADGEAGDLVAPEPVVEEDSQEGPVAGEIPLSLTK